MTETRARSRRLSARLVGAGLTIVLTSLPLAAAAADGAASPPQTLSSAIARAAATERLSASATAPAPAAQGATPDPTSRRFFKTPLGLAVIAIVGAGTAYAVYSAQNDRIHSTAR